MFINKLKLLIPLLILCITLDIVAQDYQFILQPRRSYDKIKVEIWAKSLNPNTAKLGNASLVLQYNTAFLYPSIVQDLVKTDSLLPIEANSLNPYVVINTEFNSANGYNVLTSASYSAGYYSLEINHNTLGVGGLQPKTTGYGSFLGNIWFDIVGNPSETDLANIQWSKSTFPGDIAVFDINGNNIESSIIFTDPDQTYKVLGITFLSPNGTNQVVDRDARYKFLDGAYFDAGYPIYFERSVNPAIYFPITTISKNIDDDLAYLLEYSLNNGTTWNEIGRIAESDKNAQGIYYSAGEIFEPKGTTAFTITAANGQQLNATTFRLPVRVIWQKDPFFIQRSEQAKLRIIQLNENSSVAILNRTPSNIETITNGTFTLGRLFFVQLDGSTTYMKTLTNYSNATQLTVSAWVNLNSYQPAGTNPAIIASSGGSDATPIFGSNEGAWMLYLIDGRIPAFRCREILNRGNTGSNNYLAIVQAYSMDSLHAVSSATLTEAHANNWTHIAATVKDNVVSLYINGELVNQVTNNNANDIRMLVTNHPIWVGVNPNTAVTNGSFLNAGIKQIQVWRTALTQEQIRLFSTGIVNADSISNYDEIKKGLELYYSLEGTKADLASNPIYQNGEQYIEFYNDAFTGQLTPIISPNNDDNLKQNNSGNNEDLFSAVRIMSKKGESFQASVGVPPNYRPDQPHLKISAPGFGAGVLNKLNDNTEIRWITFGMTDLAKNIKLNFQIEYSIDNGETWTLAKNPAGQDLSGVMITNSDNGSAIWQPYQNNFPDANLRTISPFSKTCQLRIKGINTNGDITFISYSDTFTIAPLFSIRCESGSQLYVERRMGMNITNDYAYIEAWIKPYRFPTNGEGFFPIAEKSDVVLHYSFRLMNDGTLAFLIQDTTGTLFTARTTTDFALVAPNSIENDSAWAHCAVLFIKSNENNVSEARFYIDGNLQKQPYPQTIQLNIQNDYPLYIGSNSSGGDNSFVGEIKEIRFWNNIPNNYSIYGTEPTEFTLFVQKSQSEAVKDLMNMYKLNLHSHFKLNGGTFFANGGSRVTEVSDINGALLKNFGTPVQFVPCKPFIKLVEPQFRQSISNSDKGVRVRWVGMYYNGLNFTAGASKTAPSLEYSIRGGGGNEIQPYQYVGSTYFSGNKVNSVKLPQTTDCLSELTANKKYFALVLDASMANPDVNKDGNFVDQGAFSPVLTNARLRLTGNFTINGETLSLKTEGPLFTINPLSNFTVRVMLEGYHQGAISGKTINQLGSEYSKGGLRIRLFTDNSGEIGQKVGTDGSSVNGYTERDPVNLNKGNNRFGNVDFVFTDISDGSYWLLLEHINHLPIMSRYPAPFQFTGDVPQTWIIESGWDFTSWNGVDDNVMPSPYVMPWSGNYYSAKGNAINKPSTNPDRYSTTGLIYNGGTTNINGLAAMVGGDVNQDNIINAADRVKVRQDEGMQSYQSDITGDKYVNAVDRTITDRNYGKVSSLLNTTIPPTNILVPTVPFIAINFDDVPLSNYFNKMAKYKTNNVENISKEKNKFLASHRYEVSAILIYNDSGYVDLSMFIKNVGDEFAPANCTFPISFDTSQVEFMKLLNADSALFNSTFDYNNIDKAIPENGYLKLSSAPKSLTSDAYKNIRSIEIDYDAYTNIGGINVPYQPTFLGTLRFKVKQNAGVVAFNWHESKAVFTTKGNNITNDGNWLDIPTILLYTGKILQPNGGEEYSVSSMQIIKWTTSKITKVFLEFSSNNGYNWQRLNDTAISSSISNELKELEWITPFITSNLCLIRIVDATTLMEIDRSDTVFSINPPWGNILKPYTSNEVYRGGSTTTIEWTSGGTSCVRFEFSADNGITWTEIKGQYDANKGKTNWGVPRITTKNALIRMFDCESNILLSTSGKFIILNGLLTFTAPSQGQKLRSNSKFKVKWTHQYVDIFDLDISLDSGRTWIRVASDVNAIDLNYDWLVPNINTDSALFRALYQSDPIMEYSRSKIFKISGATYINEISTNFYVSEVFPNPTKNKASVELNLEHPVNICIELINPVGEKICDIVNNKYINLGEHIVNFDLKYLVPGKYYLLIKSNKFIVLREILINK
jgi:hypothetical protein